MELHEGVLKADDLVSPIAELMPDDTQTPGVIIAGIVPYCETCGRGSNVMMANLSTLLPLDKDEIHPKVRKEATRTPKIYLAKMLLNELAGASMRSSGPIMMIGVSRRQS